MSKTCINCTSATKRGLTGVHSGPREAMAKQGYLGCKQDTSEARFYSPRLHTCDRWAPATAEQVSKRAAFALRFPA